MGDPDTRLKFDMVHRAHLNFVENSPQYLATAYFALQLAPALATLFGCFFLLGRVAFSLGYYSGDATAKNKVLSHATHFWLPLRGRQLPQACYANFRISHAAWLWTGRLWLHARKIP